MTVFGWDCSGWDHDRHPVNLADARAAGISLFTHKITQGNGFHEPTFAATITRAAAVGMPVIGAYHLLLPPDIASIADQAAFYVSCLNGDFPDWERHPCFIHQIDCEPWQFTGNRAPSLADIRAFASQLLLRPGFDGRKIVVYAPRWAYGDSLAGLGYPLWSSSYVGSGEYRSLYPGDNGVGWQPYSGQTPLIWQYSEASRIGSQPTCDVNAIRVADEAALVALFSGTGTDSGPTNPIGDLFTVDQMAQIQGWIKDAQDAVNQRTKDVAEGVVQRVNDHTDVATKTAQDAVNTRTAALLVGLKQYIASGGQINTAALAADIRAEMGDVNANALAAALAATPA